jgi:hypothetical protein
MTAADQRPVLPLGGGLMPGRLYLIGEHAVTGGVRDPASRCWAMSSSTKGTTGRQYRHRRFFIGVHQASFNIRCKDRREDAAPRTAGSTDLKR